MRLLTLTVLVVVILPATADAAAPAPAWSQPLAYDAAPAACAKYSATIPISCVGEPAPSAAVEPHGSAVAAWIDLHDRVRVTVADAARHFGHAVTLGTGLRPAVAISPRGVATVAWSDRSGTLRFRRRPRGGRFAPARSLAARGSKQGDDLADAAGAPDGSVTFVYRSPFRGPNGSYVERIRAVTVSPGGRPAAPATLGRGFLGHDSTRATADGTLVVCCLQPPVSGPDTPPETGQRVAVYRPATGWTTLATDAVGKNAIETVAGSADALLLGTLQVERSGDAGSLGVPGFARGAAVGPFGPALRAQVTSPSRGLAPNVAIDGSGRSVLVFQEKARAQAFSRDAPVYATVAAAAATSAPARQRLAATQAYEPAVRPLGAGAISVWAEPGERWGTAIETDGTFHRAPAPAGLGPSRLGEDFNFNRDIETNGSRAVMAWTARDGSVRVSELG